jgi:hypothetical protein
VAAALEPSSLSGIHSQFAGVEGSRLSTVHAAIQQYSKMQVAFLKSLAQSAAGLLEKMGLLTEMVVQPPTQYTVMLKW